MAPPSYATRAELEAYAFNVSTLDNAAKDALVAAASRDIDTLAITRPAEDDGSRFVVADLTDGQAAALSRATCAQAEYRQEMGPGFFARPQFAQVTGPDFSTQGTLPHIGPKVWRELAGTGLIKLSTSTQEGLERAPWYDFAYGVDD